MSAEIEKVKASDPALDPWRNEVIEASRDIWVGRWNGKVVLVWGLIPQSLISDTAYVWSASTPEVRHCAKALLKLSRQWVREVQAEFTILTGFCECKTSWLSHLGAEFRPGIRQFYEFQIRAK